MGKSKKKRKNEVLTDVLTLEGGAFRLMATVRKMLLETGICIPLLEVTTKDNVSLDLRLDDMDYPRLLEEEIEERQRMKAELETRKASQAIYANWGWTTFATDPGRRDQSWDPSRHRTSMIMAYGANQKERIYSRQPYIKGPNGRVFFGQITTMKGSHVLTWWLDDINWQ